MVPNDHNGFDPDDLAVEAMRVTLVAGIDRDGDNALWFKCPDGSSLAEILGLIEAAKAHIIHAVLYGADDLEDE